MTHLAHHEILASEDLHEMQEILARLTDTHEVDVIGSGHEIAASLRSADLGGLDLMHVTYGDVSTRVRTHAQDEDALLLFVLTGGRASVEHKGEAFEISTATGLMRDTRVPLSARQEAFESFVVPLPVDVLKRHAAALLGEDAQVANVTFEPSLDMNSPGGRHLRATVHYIAEALDGPLLGVDNPIALGAFKDLLLTSVLALLPNSHSDRLLDRRPAKVLPYHVKRARDFIHAHAAAPISLEALARHAGCGLRTLQIAFNDAYGMSPTAYIRSVRLSRAHDDLIRADHGMTVREIALKWGFAHMGWFSKCYLEQFGVPPSQTLRTRG